MLLTEYYSSLAGYNTKKATNDANISIYRPRCLLRFLMLAYMLSPTDFICLGDGGTDGGSDGKSSLDLLRDEDGNSDESSGYQVDDGASLLRFIDAL
ncbi:hypothetical protein Tco_1016405 [Tanacetum coccineum]|uniref:Uncharacterized protein n=1 Tax=Tanacetum coccineum TaxID=301880 RepID=A0ABQ5FNI4_9ASTR